MSREQSNYSYLILAKITFYVLIFGFLYAWGERRREKALNVIL